ncbi:MAG: ATP-binding protein [Mycobacterium sp.]
MTGAQADNLYELISERTTAAGSMILTSNRSPVDWYPSFANPVVAESLLNRLITSSNQVFMNGRSCRPTKRAGGNELTSARTATSGCSNWIGLLPVRVDIHAA